MFEGLRRAVSAPVRVLQEGEAALRTVAAAVSDSEFGSASLQRSVARLSRALQQQRRSGEAAVGVAAPQIGWGARAVLVDNAAGAPRVPHTALLNARLTVLSSGADTVVAVEACLSVPNTVGCVHRPRAVRVDYRDVQGRARAALCSGWVSALVCHELDHLDGVLFTDRAHLLFPANEWEHRMADDAFAKTICFDGAWEQIDLSKD